MPRAHRLAVTLVLLATAAAADASEPAADPRIRTADARLRALIDRGVEQSPTFRALVERIEQSDLVVYVMCDGPPRSRIAGRLTFLTAAAGIRYLVVRVAEFASAATQIGVLGHELQHAVEIADAPAVVDGPSLAREYLRIGHVTNHTTNGLSFDTDAAVIAGRQVLGEMIAATGD